MADKENPTKDASGAAGNQAPAASTNGDKTPKFEFKEGVMLADGRKIVYESDLIATKKSLEQQIEQAQAVHNAAIDKARLDLSATQQQVAASNAKLQEAEKARDSGASGAVDAAELAKLKKEVEDAKAALTTATSSTSEYRKRLLMTAFPGVTAEQLKDKTPAQLDALEEALKTVATARGGGLGTYAVGGGAGGTGPVSDMDRAKAVLAATPVRGTRAAEVNK